MRPKVNEELKRSTIIGVKTDKTTKAKIEYIASYAGERTSTYIFNLITEHIEQFTKMTHIEWDKELKEGGKQSE